MKSYCNSKNPYCPSCSVGNNMFGKIASKIVPYSFRMAALGIVLYAAADQFYLSDKKVRNVELDNREFVLKKDSLNLKYKSIESVLE